MNAEFFISKSFELKLKRKIMRIHKTIFVAFLALGFAACSNVQQTPSPSETLKKFIEASKKNDVETLKQVLSKGTLKMIEQSAKLQNITLDEALKKDNGKTLDKTPEIRNEKIENETAIVEVKNAETSDWDKIPFVKEDGQWKLALDKFQEQIMRKALEETKTSDMNMPKIDDNVDENADEAPKNSSTTNKKP